MDPSHADSVGLDEYEGILPIGYGKYGVGIHPVKDGLVSLDAAGTSPVYLEEPFLFTRSKREDLPCLRFVIVYLCHPLKRFLHIEAEPVEEPLLLFCHDPRTDTDIHHLRFTFLIVQDHAAPQRFLP